MEHISRHHSNSLLIGWLVILLALTIERPYRLRYLHRGNHRVHTAVAYPDQDADHPACSVSPGPARLILRITAGSMTRRMQPEQESFGFALQPEDGSFGTVANVFSDRAGELVIRRRIAFGVMLGHLMAHELGHLLLGIGAHSSAGIMHVPWHNNELDILRRGLMDFMPAEAERMRTSIRACEVAQRTTEATIVPRN